MLSHGCVQRLKFVHTVFFNLYEKRHTNIVPRVCTEIGIWIHTYFATCIKVFKQMLSHGCVLKLKYG